MFEKVNKGKRWLYSSPLWKDNCSEKRLKSTLERTKTQTFPIFNVLILFFVKIATNFEDWILEKIQQRKKLVVE